MHRQTNDNNTEEPSNDDYKTSDVMVQSTPSLTYQSQIQESLSPYDALNITTQVVRSQQIKPYEKINNDVWNEIFPVNGKQLKTRPIPLQQISNSSHQKDSTQMNDPLNNSACNKTSQISIIDNDPTEEGNTCFSRSSLNDLGIVPDGILDHPLLPVHPDLINKEQSEELRDSTSLVVAALQSQIRTNLNEMLTSAVEKESIYSE